MPWPFSSAPAVPAPRTFDGGAGLCLMQQAWKCTSRRRRGSCYCSGHTCDHAGCINVVSGPRARHCQRHQILAIAPRPAAPVGAPASPFTVTGPGAQKRLAAQIRLGFQSKIDEEDRKVALAFARLASSPEFKALLQAETTTTMQLLDVLSSHAMVDDLHWSGIARFLEEQMNVYIRGERNFAAHLCQDLLLFCSAKIDKAQVEFVLFVTKLMVLPLLGPAIAGVSAAASAASGGAAGVAVSQGLDKGASGALTGASKLAQKAMDIDPGKHSAAAQPIYPESQGMVNDVVEYFNKLRASPITFARVMSLLLARNAAVRGSDDGKALVAHFGPQFLLWHKVLDR